MYSIMKINDSSVVPSHTLIVPYYEKLSNSLVWALKPSPEIDRILGVWGLHLVDPFNNKFNLAFSLRDSKKGWQARVPTRVSVPLFSFYFTRVTFFYSIIKTCPRTSTPIVRLPHTSIIGSFFYLYSLSLRHYHVRRSFPGIRKHKRSIPIEFQFELGTVGGSE